MERFNDVITHANQYINGGELMRVAPSALGPTAVCHFCFLLLLLFLFFSHLLAYLLFQVGCESQPTCRKAKDAGIKSELDMETGSVNPASECIDRGLVP